MALGATIFRAVVGIADMDRHYYADHTLTLARHPSETDERLMVRLLAFVMFASEHLIFGPGLSAEGEPDLVETDLTGSISHWIEIGLPDERDVRRACGRAKRVTLFIYGRTATMWWEKNSAALARFEHLSVIQLSVAETTALAAHAARNMRINCSIQDKALWFSGDGGELELHPQVLM